MARSVTAIKNKYGKDAFKRWGGKTGGSPVLKAWAEGKIPKHYVKSK
jgi:hypothetical protein